jgi:alpha-mannosidase
MTASGPRVLLALVAAATAPAGPEWLRGYRTTLSGVTMSYHSPYPDISSALLVRATDGTMSIEWETEPVPAEAGGRPATFVWLAGLATGKGAHRFDLAVDGKPALSFRTSADSSRKEWQETGAGGVSLSFKTLMVDQFDELFGLMRLEVPATLLSPGRPLRLLVTGEKAGSNDWFMVFRDDLRRDVWAQSEQALIRKGGRLFQVVRVEISHLAPPGKAVVSCGEAEKVHLDLKLGYNALEFLVPAVEEERQIAVQVAMEDGAVLKGSLLLKPVVPREIWLLPHSHVDIGYSDLQTVVEKNQWRYNREAVALAEKTAGYPEGARFKWNFEQAWVVETYFNRAGEADKAAFLEAIRNGSIGLQATLAGVLTGLCHPEELIHLTDFSRRLGALAGTAVDSAMVTDIPSQSWSLVPALALAGVKYVSSGPNYMPSLADGGDRIGWALKTWGDRPFYWLSPSGREKILFWMAGRGYSWFHGLNMGSLPKAPRYRILEYMNELAGKGYPYSMVQVRYTIGGDNGPPDPDLADYVRKWNEEYHSPKIVIATASEMFREFERRHGGALPLVRGDFTGYWEDGAASTAAETALNRASAGRLVQAETLWSVRGKDAFPDGRFAEAWRQVVLFSEHTWGASDSISNPDGENARAQWDYKKAFATEAERMSKELLAEAAKRSFGAALAADREAIDIVNTCSWERTDLVTVPAAMSGAGDMVRDGEGRDVPSQRLRTGELAFLASAVPGFGAKRYVVSSGPAAAMGRAGVKGRAFGSPLARGLYLRASTAEVDPRVKPGAPAAVNGNEVGNGKISAGIGPDTGAVTSLRWADGPARELVDRDLAPGLGHYLYVPGTDPKTARTVSTVKVRPGEKGPLVASLIVESDAPGAKGLVREFRVIAGLSRFEIVLTLDKKKVREKEGVHIAFPFDVAGGTVRVDVGSGSVRPEADQIPGACRDFFCARDSVDISNNDFGVTWTPLDAPLGEIGTITDETPGDGERRSWLKSLDPSTLLFSYAMNNYWHTNYRADQEGPVTLRYAVEPHRGADPATAKKLGAEAMTPLVPMRADAAAPVPRFPLAVEPGSFVATSLRPSADGKAWILRLLNASDRPEELRLSGEAFDRGRVFLSDLGEGELIPVAGSVNAPGFGILTLRVRK